MNSDALIGFVTGLLMLGLIIGLVLAIGANFSDAALKAVDSIQDANVAAAYKSSIQESIELTQGITSTTKTWVIMLVMATFGAMAFGVIYGLLRKQQQ